MIDLGLFQLPAAVPAQVWTLLGLLLGDVLFAVALALKNSTFEWKKLPKFYETKLVPLIVGWIAFMVLIKFVSPALLGTGASWLTDGAMGEGIVWFAWLRVVALLTASIYQNARDLYGDFFPPKPDLTNETKYFS